MDYGLSEPKLALMKDGGVFVAGQIQAPMEAPVVPQKMRWDAEAKVFRAVSGDLVGTILMVGSAMLGTLTKNQVLLMVATYSRDTLLTSRMITSLNYLQAQTGVSNSSRPELTQSTLMKLRVTKAELTVIAAHGAKKDIKFIMTKTNADGTPVLLDGNPVFEEKIVTTIYGLQAPDGYTINRTIQFQDAYYGLQEKVVPVPILPLPGAKAGGDWDFPIRADVLLLDICWSKKIMDYWQTRVEPVTAPTAKVILTNGTVDLDWMLDALAYEFYQKTPLTLLPNSVIMTYKTRYNGRGSFFIQ
jgi:hypothetical protein